MKIIWTDNFARDEVSQKLIASGLDDYHGKLIEKFLQDRCTNEGPDWYYLVPDDYKLHVWEP